jgi:hypothetical protein
MGASAQSFAHARPAPERDVPDVAGAALASGVEAAGSLGSDAAITTGFADSKAVIPEPRAQHARKEPHGDGETSTPRASSVATERDALYIAAHAAHFGGARADLALAAWDRYLAVAHGDDPQSGFVLEARYNRAICLVRLGRYDEAREALRPFAGGAYQGYRRADAQSLIDKMEARGF